MNRQSAHRAGPSEAGYTLIELIISLTLLAVITGALVAAFITTNSANANVSERIHESNDAQIIAGFWTADAQAAGGVDPALGATDTSLGVSKSDDGGCGLGGGALVSRFKWKEWLSRDTTTTADAYTTRVANYVFQSSTNELQRRTCANGTSTGVVTLATRVAAAPEVRCDGSLTCPVLPGTVSIRVTETGDASTSQPAYVFTLSATVRPNDQTAPGSGNAAGSPLLALGSSTCSNGTTGLSVSGNTTVVVNGQAAINGSDIPGCTAMVANGSIQYNSDGTSLVPGGTCSGNQCPPTTTDATRIGDPFASLPAPSVNCSGSGNPALIGGHFQPGTYKSAVTLNGILDPGQYYFCNTVGWGTVSGTGVFMYFTGSSSISIAGQASIDLKSMTTGAYAGILMWNATANAVSITGGGSFANYNGALYSPNADVTVAGNSDTYIGMIVAKRIFFSGSHTTDITNGSVTPGAPGLTATPGPGLRQVHLSWTVPGYTGAVGFPITGYEFRVNSGSGFGAWTTIPGGAAVTTYDHTCGTSDTVPTTCTYQVRALNGQGAGTASAPAQAQSLVDNTAPVPTVTAPANGATVAAVTTFSGTAGTAAGDLTAITVQVWSGAGCTGTLLQTRNATAAGGTWSVASTAMTSGAKYVCAYQSDAYGNNGQSTAVNFTADATPPSPTTLAIANGGTLLRVDKGDTVTITFSEAINPATLCAAWNGTTSRTSVTVTVTNNDATTGGNDSLTVTDASCAGGFNFGKVNLGSANWVTATTNFSGGGGNASSAGFNPGLTTLTIKLGNGTAGPTAATSTMIYTPAAAIADAVGNLITGTATGTNQRF